MAMLSKCSRAVRPLILFSMIGGSLVAAGSLAARPQVDNSPSFRIEIPEAKIEATNQPNINLESTNLQLILIHLLRPDADNIDYGQIFPKVNGAAASRIAETRPALNGKVLRLSLHARPGFELLPGNNSIEVLGTAHNGKVIAASFNLHAPVGACRGGGRAKILELTALGDLVRAGVTQERLIQLVVACGVSFLPSSETDQKLQDLGAQPNLLAAIRNPAAAEFRSYQSSAVKLDQVLELLASHVQESNIIANVEDNGIDFKLTPEVEEKLRAAGASQKLIESVRYMAGAESPEAADQALSVSQILHLMEGGAVAKDRLFSLIQQRGVNFKLDRGTEDRLRQGGANEKLMHAIRDAAGHFAATH